MSSADATREQGQTNVAPVPRSGADERRGAWIGQAVVIEGKVRSAQDLRIDGTINGAVEVSNHVLIIGASAAIKANLAAKSILISGTVMGNVTATDRIDVQATAVVEGDVSAPRLVLVDGAVVKGKVETGVNRTAKRE